MSAILPPSERLWWKHPLDRVEGTWIAIALAWCLTMFFMMVGWHIYGKQNLSTETYKTTPEKFSAKAIAQARNVGIARVLGTYGGPGEGTVFDVIQSTENNLGELFAAGMTRVVDADGNEVSGFVPGGEPIYQLTRFDAEEIGRAHV